MNDDRGIHSKYKVERTDGSSGPGGKHEGCTYFVLDLEHDEYAIPALKAYAKACRRDNPALAADLASIIEIAEMPRCSCREAFCPHSLARAFTPETAGEQMARLIADAEDTKR